MDTIVLKSLLIAVVLGFAIGLQRTMQQIYSKEKLSIAGSRTFALISLLGFLSGWLAKSAPQLVVLVALASGSEGPRSDE